MYSVNKRLCGETSVNKRLYDETSADKRFCDETSADNRLCDGSCGRIPQEDSINKTSSANLQDGTIPFNHISTNEKLVNNSLKRKCRHDEPTLVTKKLKSADSDREGHSSEVGFQVLEHGREEGIQKSIDDIPKTYVEGGIQKVIFDIPIACVEGCIKKGHIDFLKNETMPVGDVHLENISREEGGKQDSHLDIYRTGAKCVEGGKQDSHDSGENYHTVGLFRIKPGRGVRTLSMSCSDKLARWNVLGCQGALLTLMMSSEPVYFTTITCGK